MSQTWNVPIDASDLLSDSRVDINDALASLQTNFIGASDPTGGVLVDGLSWFNTTNPQKIKARKAGATIILGDFDVDMGHLRRDGTNSMTGPIDMNSNLIFNVGTPNPGSTNAARISDVELRVAKTGDVMSGALSFSGQFDQYLFADNSVATIGRLNTKLSLAGGTVTGLIYAPPLVPPGPDNRDYFLRRDDIEKLATFSTSVGHRHTGIDGRKVSGIHIASLTSGEANEAAGKALRSNGDGSSSWVSFISGFDIYALWPTIVNEGSKTSFQVVDLTGIVNAGTKYIAVGVTCSTVNNTFLRVNGGGSSDSGVATGSTTLPVTLFVELDASLRFEWKNTSSSGTTVIKLYAGIRT